MAYYKRNIDKKLLEWKDAPRRKPLLIRGARQVGKSTIDMEFEKMGFSYVSLDSSRDREMAKKDPDLFCHFSIS